MGRRLAGESLTVGTVSAGGTEYSTSCSFEQTTGNACVLLASTAGSVTVTQQCSLNGTDWYDPISSVGGALGVVCTAQGVTTGIYVEYSAVPSPHIRFKVIEGGAADTTVTIRLIFQEAVR